jgi:AAA domain
VGDRPKSIYRLGSGQALRWINHLVYGHPGVGKTPYWGTASKGLLMDSDSGVESAEAYGSNIEVVPNVNGFKEVSEVYQYLAYGGGCDQYDWIIWDGGTLFMDRVLVDEIMKDAAAQNPKEDEDVASQRSYLVLQNRFGDYVRRFVSLPINFGMSAHVMTAEDPEGQLMYVPFFPGKKGEYSSKISGYFNLVTYYGMTPKTGTRRFLTEKRGYYFSRDRFHAVRTVREGKSMGYLNNPTVPKVEQLISEAKATRRTGNGQGQGTRRQEGRRRGSRRR